MGCVSNSVLFSANFASSNSHSHWILTLYPPSLSPRFYSLCVHTSLTEFHRSVYWDPWSDERYDRENNSPKTRTRSLSRNNIRPHCRTVILVIFIRARFSHVIFCIRLLAPCVRVRWRPYYCSFDYRYNHQWGSVLLCMLLEISYVTLYYMHIIASRHFIR